MGIITKTTKVINNGLDKIEECFDLRDLEPDERENIAISAIREAERSGKKKIKIRL
jgi:hypothetical protein